MNHKNNNRGQDLIEYAFIMPFMLLAIMFIFDLGSVTFLWSSLNHVSREGARYGVVNPCDDPGVIQTAVDRAIGLDLDSNPDPDANGNFDIVWNPSDCSYPDDPGTATVSVSVDYDYEPFAEFIIGILGGSTPLNINSTTTMHLEQ